MHYTVHHADHTKERSRIPLRTADVAQARKRRDASFESFFGAGARRGHRGAPSGKGSPKDAAECHDFGGCGSIPPSSSGQTCSTDVDAGRIQNSKSQGTSNKLRPAETNLNQQFKALI